MSDSNADETEESNSKGLYGGNTLSIHSGKAVVGVDSLKNFQVEIGKMRDDPNNMIIFDLYYEDSRGTAEDPGELNRVKLGTQEFHAFDFIGDMNGSKSIIFSNKQTTLLEMEIDFAFRYGLFGYGFASQVEQKQLDQKYILSQSIFPRIPVPGFRKDSDFVCEPIHVDYPEFINLEERSYIGSDPVRRQANKFTQEQMVDGGHILNIKLNPLTARSYESLGPTRSRDSVASSLFDEENQYIVSQSTQAKFLMDVMNRRKRLPGIIRKYACKRTRYERLKYLETVIAKRGEIIGRGTMNSTLGTAIGDDNQINEELTYAEILMQMAPGVNNRTKRESEVKKTSSKLFGSFKSLGKAIGRASNMFSLAPSRTNLGVAGKSRSKMSLAGGKSNMSLRSVVKNENSEKTIEDVQAGKITSNKNSFGFIEEEDEYDEEQL